MPGTSSALSIPELFALDEEGNLFIGHSANQRIRRVDADSGRITTVYGTGKEGASSDGISAREASFAYFGSLLFDS